MPMTHPSDFYCFKGLTASCTCQIETFYLLLVLSKNPVPNVNIIFHTTFCVKISCSVTEIMSLAWETMKARAENRPKQIHLVKNDLAVTSRPKSDKSNLKGCAGALQEL